MTWVCTTCEGKTHSDIGWEGFDYCKTNGHVIESTLSKPLSPEEQPVLKTELPMHEITTDHEGKEIIFNCIINGLDEPKTYYKKAIFTCPRCGMPSEELKCDDLYQIEPPRCEEHGLLMKLERKYNDEFTDSIRYVRLEEPIEEALNANPQRYMAISRGKECLDLAIGQRKKVKAVFKSVPTAGKMKYNDIILDIMELHPMEEIKEELPTEEELGWMQEEAKKPSFVNSVASSITNKIGLEDEQLSILLSLVKGDLIPDVVKRDDIHVFLMGNPSVAKSELLEFAQSITPRSQFVSTESASKAGIRGGIETLSNGSHMFVAGSMTTANGSHLFIDELDKMPKEDFAALYRAMEQQFINYDKIIHVKLAADTSIIAAANPKNGYYDKDLTLQQNFNIPFALQTRFDLIWFIPSTESEELIKRIAEQATSTTYKWEPYMPKAVLAKYINHVKRLHPKMTVEAGRLINDFWSKAKTTSVKQKDGIKIETRHLHGLIRISMAFAKLQFHESVTEDDARAAIGIFTRSLKSLGQDVETGETTQGILFGKKENKDKIFQECVNRLSQKEEIIEPEELEAELVKTGMYDIYNAREKCKHEAHRGEVIITTFNNKYKISK